MIRLNEYVDVMMQILIIFSALANLLCLMVYWLDKNRARRGLRRLTERRLLLCTFLGPLGSVFGIWWIRHKNRKISYLIKYFIVMALSVLGHICLGMVAVAEDL